MKRFVVVIQGVTAAQADAITAAVRDSKKFNWWHWMDQTWLLLTNELYTPKTVAEWIQTRGGLVWPAQKILVLDSDTHDFWGSVQAEAWPWMRDHWKGGQ
jgi:hypothetical protein